MASQNYYTWARGNLPINLYKPEFHPLMGLLLRRRDTLEKESAEKEEGREDKEEEGKRGRRERREGRGREERENGGKREGRRQLEVSSKNSTVGFQAVLMRTVPGDLLYYLTLLKLESTWTQIH